MSKLKSIFKKLPGYKAAERALLDRRERRYLKTQDTAQIFNEIFLNNTWNGKTSFSGRGSDPDQTKTITKKLPALFKELEVTTVLDIPCGDFRWMKHVDLSGTAYTGADIVEDLIKRNTEQHGGAGMHFQRLDLIEDMLPPSDLLFCRDCLVHLSFDDIFAALNNICRSNSNYLLTTTFPARRKNKSIETGQWRVLNLEIAPFELPAPLKVINEGCTEGNGIYADKALGLWSIPEVRESLTRHRV